MHLRFLCARSSLKVFIFWISGSKVSIDLLEGYFRIHRFETESHEHDFDIVTLKIDIGKTVEKHST